MLANQQNRLFVVSLHLAGAAVVALTLGGFYAMIYQPLERQHTMAADRTEQLDAMLLRSGSEGREYRRLRDQLTAMTASVTELHGQLTSPQSGTALVADLRGIADDVDLEVLDTQIGLTKTLPTHSHTEVALRCHGSYASICRFLEQAEKLTKTTKLSKFELAASENSRRYPVHLTFVLYSDGNSHDTKEKRGFL